MFLFVVPYDFDHKNYQMQSKFYIELQVKKSILGTCPSWRNHKY